MNFKVTNRARAALFFLVLLPAMICVSFAVHTVSAAPVVDVISKSIAGALESVSRLLSLGGYTTSMQLGFYFDNHFIFDLNAKPLSGGDLSDASRWPVAWIPFQSSPRISRSSIMLSILPSLLLYALHALLPQSYKGCVKVFAFSAVVTFVVMLYAARVVGFYSISLIRNGYVDSDVYWLASSGLSWSCLTLLPLATMSLLLGLTYGFPKRPYAKGHCGQCGYDCAGLAVCPECGNTDPAARPSQGIRYFFRPVTYFSLFVCSLFLPSFVSLGIKLVGAITG